MSDFPVSGSRKKSWGLDPLRRHYECSRCEVKLEHLTVFQDVFGPDEVIFYFCQECYEAQRKHVCETCGIKLHVGIEPGCYKEVTLDKTLPGGVKELFFCKPHWHDYHLKQKSYVFCDLCSFTHDAPKCSRF